MSDKDDPTLDELGRCKCCVCVEQRKTKPTPPERKIMFAVMLAQPWGLITVGGISIAAPTGGPQKFIPVFDTYQQAVDWNGGPEHIAMLEEVAKP